MDERHPNLLYFFSFGILNPFFLLIFEINKKKYLHIINLIFKLLQLGPVNSLQHTYVQSNFYNQIK